MAVTNETSHGSAGQAVGQKDPSDTARENASSCSYYGKQYGGSSKIKNRTTTIQQSLFWQLPEKSENIDP